MMNRTGRRMAKRERREMGREMENVKFTQEYFRSLVSDYVAWKADARDMDVFFNDTGYMNFPIRYACDNSIVLDAGTYNMYIEWGVNECPVYVDIRGEYTYVGKIRNARFWALADRVKK